MVQKIDLYLKQKPFQKADIKVELVKEGKKHKGVVFHEKTIKFVEDTLDKIKKELESTLDKEH